MPLVRSLIVGVTLLAAALGPSVASAQVMPRSSVPPLLRAPIDLASRCFPVGGSGTFSLNLPGGYIALSVSPAASFGEVTGLQLAGVDPSSVPGTPGQPNSAVVFYVGARENCVGAELSQVSAAVTLSVYRLGSPQGGLGLARLDHGQWTVIATPSFNGGFYANPPLNDGVVSTTIQQTGTYAAYQRP
jgi:hypothetical protein